MQFTQADVYADYQTVKTKQEMEQYLAYKAPSIFKNILRMIAFPSLSTNRRCRWRIRFGVYFATLNEKVDAKGNKFPKSLYKTFLFKKMCSSESAMKEAIEKISIEGTPEVTASEAYRMFQLLQEALLPILVDKEKVDYFGGAFRKVLATVL